MNKGSQVDGGYLKSTLDGCGISDGQVSENTLEIIGSDGKLLLRIGPAPDYEWEAPDAPEAARIFVRTFIDELRGFAA